MMMISRNIGVCAAIVVAAGAALLAPASARADVSGPFVTTTPIASTLTDWTSTLSFPKFNSALGTLLSVQLDLSGAINTTITVTNSAGSSSSGTAKTECQFTVQDGGNNLIAPQLDLLSPIYGYSLAPGGSSSSGLLTKSGNSSDLYTSAPVLAAFNGPGTIILNASTFTQTLLANTGGNTAANQVTTGSLTGTVTYVYEAVPAPASVALLGLGGLVAVRRRR